MDDKICNYLDKIMVPILGGTEHLRNYRDEQKWISSNSKMSIPGLKGNLSEIKTKVCINTFLIARYTVTKSLYKVITQKELLNVELDFIPMVNVSWYDAISFCNLLSKKCGLKECYTFDHNGSNVFLIGAPMDTGCQQMQNGNMHVKLDQQDTDMERLRILHGILETRMVRFMR